MSLSQTLTDNCEDLGSKIELINNSKELGENSLQSNTQNFFLRVGKPGKLYFTAKLHSIYKNKSRLNSIKNRKDSFKNRNKYTINYKYK